jgi:acyl carrier protein
VSDKAISRKIYFAGETMTNLEKYVNAFTQTFGIDAEKTKDLNYNSIVEWDSVGHMELIAVLEETFGIAMEMDDIVDFSSFEKGKEILSKYNIIFE